MVVQATGEQAHSNASPLVDWHLCDMLPRLHVAGCELVEAGRVEAGHTCNAHAVLQHHLLQALSPTEGDISTRFKTT